ncbi:MAG: DUF305 domain-containing protein [Beijerinckiaceae bacterium]
MFKRIIVTFAFAILLSSGPVNAQHHGHSGHSAPAANAALTPAAKAFAQANAKMHRDMNVPLSGNADADFVRSMIPHHQGAVEMAEIILNFGRKPEIAKLAGEIIAAQKREIAEMTTWLEKNPSPAAQPEAAGIRAAFAAANATMHRDMTIDYSQDSEKDFMRGMIPHHEGAVAMAKILQQFGRDPELLKLAANVIRSQNDEITLMKKWLAEP